MTTKPNPFLAGMRAMGREPFTTDEERKEYESGYMAIHDMTCALEAMDTLAHIGTTDAMQLVTRIMAEVETTWSRIKAALASEVTPAHCECGDDPHTTYNGTVKAYTCDDCGKPVKS